MNEPPLEPKEMPRTYKFTLAYEGADAEAGMMDIEELSPALMGLANVISEACRIHTEDRAKIKAYVNADFKHGSFAIDMQLVLSLKEQLQDLVTNLQVNTLKEILELAGLAGAAGIVGFLKLRKKLGGRDIEKVTVQNNVAVYVTRDGEQIEVSQETHQMMQSSRAEKGAADFTRPVRAGSADSLTIAGEETEELTRFDRTDAQAIAAPPSINNAIESETVMRLRVADPSFSADRQWRVTDGDNIYRSYLADKDFLDKIMNHEVRLGYEDRLLVRMKTIQTEEQNTLKTRHEILEVIEHVPFITPEQQEFPADDEHRA